jgi:hypothetical protein
MTVSVWILVGVVAWIGLAFPAALLAGQLLRRRLYPWQSQSLPALPSQDAPAGPSKQGG